MLMSEVFPSKFLRAADIDEDDIDEDLRCIIEKVAHADDPQIEKPLLFLEELDKALVLNRTNANATAAEYGDNTQAWIRQPIILFTQSVTFQGRTAPAIRVRNPRRKPAEPGLKAAAPQQGGPTTALDDIPFAPSR
jgi:hypothetical protein